MSDTNRMTLYSGSRKGGKAGFEANSVEYGDWEQMETGKGQEDIGQVPAGLARERGRDPRAGVNVCARGNRIHSKLTGERLW